MVPEYLKRETSFEKDSVAEKLAQEIFIYLVLWQKLRFLKKIVETKKAFHSGSPNERLLIIFKF
jgi:hypothetical protein